MYFRKFSKLCDTLNFCCTNLVHSQHLTKTQHWEIKRILRGTRAGEPSGLKTDGLAASRLIRAARPVNRPLQTIVNTGAASGCLLNGKGTVTTSTNYDNPKVEQNHNHDRCQDEVDALRARNQIKAESVKPRRLFHVVTFWSGDSRVLYLYGALCSEYRTEMNSLNSVTSDLADCMVNMCVWCMCC